MPYSFAFQSNILHFNFDIITLYININSTKPDQNPVNINSDCLHLQVIKIFSKNGKNQQNRRPELSSERTSR